MTSWTHRLLPALLAFVVAACGADAVAPSPSPSSTAGAEAPTAEPSRSPDAAATPAVGDVEPAPGSASRLFAPNPQAVVVAIEAGHGGCLDWGVADPQERGPDYSEKAITMSIARALADLVAADGATPVLIRDGDEALAGDHYPPLGCEGEPFRDVNQDGFAGFGGDLPDGTRTRDELQARLDRANLAGADVLVSLHVDSITDAAGNLLPIARTETFYTDETPWGIPLTARLAEQIQAALVASLDAVADYAREDRGTNAHNLYIVAPPLFETTPERPDPLRQPTRGALMPAVLVEIGTITLPAEHELLLSAEGASAAAQGIFDGLVAWFAEREVAGRIEPVDRAPGTVPQPIPGDGPPFRADPAGEPPLRLRITNTGTRAWEGHAVELLAGWEATTAPYLYLPPDDVRPAGVALPGLAPGESVVVEVELPAAGQDPGLAWFSLSVAGETVAQGGSPALQLSTGAP
ncbi:MAG TPA: N-acetylmuramoyl-L-alanine amidase [Candidatus Limnocylindrales bacterium]|nr:N-acetylmuramoyl-L-alanine amidase [Candidatus Limnocylindrales bacterium]